MSSKSDASRMIGNNVKNIDVSWSVDKARRNGLVDLIIEMPDGPEAPYDVAEFVGALYDEYQVDRLKTYYSDLKVTVRLPER
jgi:hypothetical protein